MGVNLGGIVEDIEKRVNLDRKKTQPQLNKLREDVKLFALQNRRQINQGIKTYSKQGIIKGFHKLYPNHPNLRMKYAKDWESTCTPHSTPGMTGGADPHSPAHWSCEVLFDQELDNNGNPLEIPGHDGLCNKFRAHCIAHAGDDRRSTARATSTQTLIFNHDPPAMGEEVEYCGFSELWLPMSLTGLSYAIDTDRVYFIPRLETEGGLADIWLSIRIEQDTEYGPLIYPVTTPDIHIYGHYDIGGHWIFEGAEGVEWAPRPISLLLNEPYRLPPMTILTNEYHGGGEVRVIVTLTCSAQAINRHAEAEIDLASPGFGVEIHEVFLRGAGCIGTFSP